MTKNERSSYVTNTTFESTKKELESFKAIQDAFSKPSFLTHHNPSRRLFVDIDGSKEFGIAAMMYHVKNEVTKDFVRTNVQPILFLSKVLSPAERNYWPPKLEIATLVYTIRKIRHLIAGATHDIPTIVRTDCSPSVGALRQTSLKTNDPDKLNLRLVRASQYLQQFNLEVHHIAGKTNTVPDALSRLRPKVVETSDTDILEEVYVSTQMIMSPEFEARIREGYLQDSAYTKILGLLKGHYETEIASIGEVPQVMEVPSLQFRYDNGLLYFIERNGKRRLCISVSVQKDVFAEAHDQYYHFSF